MAALVAGVQYGLSSHSKITENKSLIFVKLTDSAQRAIEDFLRNRNKTNQNPTIQFLGNEGQLSFPSTQSSHGTAGFTFSLSGNQDIEGPQGGFECIQQTGPKSLESLGTLPCKMRIQANDDVYETTRHRMAVADENNKMKCTRVIKANGPDIGRKVKVKATGRTIPPPVPNARHRESTSIPTSSSQSSRSQSSSSSSSAPPPAPPSTTSSSSTSSSSSFSSYKPIQNSNPPPNRSQPEKKVSDLMRRPLRERLIHLLALRPYKRPELYNRITTEGIKERDRSTMVLVLKQVAFMRDNTYHLLRHVWNDVQEDWPFYTEQEKAMLKRRKPQNLTPPGSSDGGSSGSGQSPNSTHAGSPPAITAPPPGLMSLKRPGYYQSADGLQTKKPRISHFRKSDSGPTTGSGNSNGNRESARTTGSSSSGGTGVGGGGGGGGGVQAALPPPVSSAGSGGGGGGVGGGGSGGNSAVVSGSGVGSETSSSWEQRQQRQNHQQPQQRDRADYRAERTTNSDVLRGSSSVVGGSVGGGGSSYGSAKSCLTPTSDSEDNNHHSGHGHSSNSSSSSSNHHATSGANSGNGSSVSGSGNYPGSGGNHHSNSSLSYNNNPASNHHHSVNGNSSKASVGGESNSAGGGAASAAAVGGSLGVVNFVRSSGERSANSHGNSPNGVVESSRRDRGASSTTSSSSSRAYEREQRERERETEREYERDRESRENSAPAGTNSYNDENSAGNIVGAINSPPADNVGATEETEYPDYLTYYTTISSTEQRRRYKNEFSADYEEYRTLHTEVGRVAERFALLESQWRRELQNGNHERTQAIKNQIMQAYAETRNDPVHKETKRRFDYLHKKLSHIKQLVHEYDTKNLSGNGGAGGGGGGNGNGGTDVGLRGGLRN